MLDVTRAENAQTVVAAPMASRMGLISGGAGRPQEPISTGSLATSKSSGASSTAGWSSCSASSSSSRNLFTSSSTSIPLPRPTQRGASRDHRPACALMRQQYTTRGLCL